MGGETANLRLANARLRVIGTRCQKSVHQPKSTRGEDAIQLVLILYAQVGRDDVKAPEIECQIKRTVNSVQCCGVVHLQGRLQMSVVQFSFGKRNSTRRKIQTGHLPASAG